MNRLLVIFLAGILVGSAAKADSSSETVDLAALQPLGIAKVTGVQNGMTLILGDGRTVRLAGIDVPLPPKDPASASWLARAPQSALNAVAGGTTVTLLGSGELDRYGRVVAQAVRGDGLWLEGALLTAGMARVRTTPAHRELAAEMLRRENEARTAERGLWRSSFFAVRAPDDLEHSSGYFELVAGTIVRVDKKAAITVLYFDIGNATAEIARSAQKLFPPEQRDHQNLIGKRVRLRGWIAWKGHPILEIDHPEQIEILD